LEIKIVKGPGAKALKNALKGLDGKVGKVGWFENARYPDGEKNQVASVAYLQEFGGVSHVEGKEIVIPPRPFMRPTIEEKQNDWKKIAEEGSKEIFQGKSTNAKVMEDIGQKAAGQIRQKIASIWSPPLSPITIQRRLDRLSKSSRRNALRGIKEKGLGSFGSPGAGIAKPLVDTRHMLNTLINKVENE
jgi:hypothetical protein